MSMRKIADKLKNEEQKLQMTSEDVDDDDDLEGKLFSRLADLKKRLIKEV